MYLDPFGWYWLQNNQPLQQRYFSFINLLLNANHTWEIFAPLLYHQRQILWIICIIFYVLILLFHLYIYKWKSRIKRITWISNFLCSIKPLGNWSIQRLDQRLDPREWLLLIKNQIQYVIMSLRILTKGWKTKSESLKVWKSVCVTLGSEGSSACVRSGGISAIEIKIKLENYNDHVENNLFLIMFLISIL